MLRKSLVFALSILLILPSFGPATAWVGLVMDVESPAVDASHASETGQHISPGSSHHLSSDFSLLSPFPPLPSHHQAMSAENPTTGIHDHAFHAELSHHGHSGIGGIEGESDCQQLCLSCSNHCSGLIIKVANSTALIHLSEMAASSAEPTSSFLDLLYRPPILA